MLRIGLQTAVAAAATWWAMGWLEVPHVSWAIISALFTIGLSADASYHNALGRIAGSFLGVAFGLAAAFFAAGPVVIGLAVATALANMVAAAWPSMRYAAVTAAIVALDQTPEVGGALERATAIMIGTMIGAGVAFVAWPVFARNKVAYALQLALQDCQKLLELIVDSVEKDDRSQRDAVHARFLGHLEAARARLMETRFRPLLPTGARLRPAVVAVETLWHTIVILDRAVSEESHEIGREAIERLRPSVLQAQSAACDLFGQLSEALGKKGVDAPDTGAFQRALADARDQAQREYDRSASDHPGKAKGLHTLMFALDEMRRTTLELAAAMEPQDGGGGQDDSKRP